MRRAKSLTLLSKDVVDYLVDIKKLTQSDVAAVLDVDKSFISRVRSGEREFSPNQMARLAEHLGVPLGVMLIEITEPKKPVSVERRELLDLCARVMSIADAAREEVAVDQRKRVART